MYVYFIRSQGSPKRLKIGKSNSPVSRMKTLQTGCPYKLSIVGAIKCKSPSHALAVESAFHEFFKEKRKLGEWFHCTDAILIQVWDVLDQLSLKDRDVHSLSFNELLDLQRIK